jgi:hypothetical protein
MRSESASATARERAERLAAMTPGERVTLAVRLGEEGIALFMETHNLDRRAAVARIKATRRLGRRPSACAEPDAG